MDRAAALQVLFADDDEAFRHLLRVRLAQLSELEIVAGAEAVELALALRPEVVLLDVAMPRLDGFGAATLIQESLPQAAVVMHSGEMTPTTSSAPQSSSCHSWTSCASTRHSSRSCVCERNPSRAVSANGGQVREFAFYARSRS